MTLRQYLPSGNFSTIVGSIGLAGLLVLGAQYMSGPKTAVQPRIEADQTTINDESWREVLAKIEATTASLPQPPSEEGVQALLGAAQSTNITDTVARSLLVNLSNASAQGLGSDIPTQERLIASAVAQLPPTVAAKTYVRADLAAGEDTAQTQKVYGNEVMLVLGRHTTATSEAVLLAVSQATDNNDQKALLPLKDIEAEYRALSEELAALTVPKTLVPLHLQIVNDLAATAAAVGDMQKLFEDPLRGLQALKQYQFMLGELGRVFTSTAEILFKNGILFSKDEPGAAWSVFVSPYST